MQGPYMELVNKLSFKNIINLKSVSDINYKIDKIINKKIRYQFFYKNYKKILEDPEIDLVLVLTSMKEHAKISKEALRKGKHVLVEKPMATNMKDLKELMQIAKKTKKYIFAAPFVVLSPVFQAMHQEIINKSIGKISLARARYGWAGPNWGEWYYQTGGGPLFDLGVYNITTLTGLLGPVKNITAKSSISNQFRKIDGKIIKGKIGESYNVGSNKNIQNIDLAKKLMTILKTNSITIGNKVKIKFVKDRPGHDFRYALDCKKIRRELKWKSKINLNEGLEDTFQWYLNNMDFFISVSKKLYDKRLGLKK